LGFWKFQVDAEFMQTWDLMPGDYISMENSLEVAHYCFHFVALRSYDEALDGHAAYTSPPRQIDSFKAAMHFR
jgi:hypothetical protein